MLFFALFLAGYFLGVFTALAVFPPNTTELEEQEKNVLRPILSLEEKYRFGDGDVAAQVLN